MAWKFSMSSTCSKNCCFFWENKKKLHLYLNSWIVPALKKKKKKIWPYVALFFHLHCLFSTYIFYIYSQLLSLIKIQSVDSQQTSQVLKLHFSQLNKPSCNLRVLINSHHLLNIAFMASFQTTLTHILSMQTDIYAVSTCGWGLI